MAVGGSGRGILAACGELTSRGMEGRRTKLVDGVTLGITDREPRHSVDVFGTGRSSSRVAARCSGDTSSKMSSNLATSRARMDSPYVWWSELWGGSDVVGEDDGVVSVVEWSIGEAGTVQWSAAVGDGYGGEKAAGSGRRGGARAWFGRKQGCRKTVGRKKGVGADLGRRPFWGGGAAEVHGFTGRWIHAGRSSGLQRVDWVLSVSGERETERVEEWDWGFREKEIGLYGGWVWLDQRKFGKQRR